MRISTASSPTFRRTSSACPRLMAATTRISSRATARRSAPSSCRRGRSVTCSSPSATSRIARISTCASALSPTCPRPCWWSPGGSPRCTTSRRPIIARWPRSWAARVRGKRRRRRAGRGDDVTDYPLIAPAGPDARGAEARPAVRARAPLRLGLAGGGTDLSPYCDTYGGAVLNLTIARYAHAFVGPATDGVSLHAADLAVRERFTQRDALDDGRLRLHRAVHKRFMKDLFGGEWFNLSVTTSVDSPPGSGLGSSSALVVAQVEASRCYFDVPMDH